MKYSSRCHGIFFFFLFLFFPSIDAWAVSPSFDCATAIRLDEHAICANDQLAVLDRIADEAYKYLRIHQSKSFANKLNLPFIKQRQACGENVACIRKIQIASIKLFKQKGAPIESPDLEKMDLIQNEATVDGHLDISSGAQSARLAPQEMAVPQEPQGAGETQKQQAEPLLSEENAKPSDNQEASATPVASDAEKVDGSTFVQPAQGASTIMDATPIAAPIDHQETQLPVMKDKLDSDAIKAHQQKFNVGFIVALTGLSLITLALSYKILTDRNAPNAASDVSAHKGKKIEARAAKSTDRRESLSTTGYLPARKSASGLAADKSNNEKIPQAWVWSYYKGQI